MRDIGCGRWVSLLLVVASLAPVFVAAQTFPGVPSQDAPAPQEIAPPSPNDVRELMRLLSDESVLHWLREQVASGDMPIDDAEQASPQQWLEQQLRDVEQSQQRVLGAWQNAKRNVRDFARAAARESQDGQLLRSLVYVIVFLIIGAGIEWLYWRYAWSARRQLEAGAIQAPESLLAKTGLRALLTAIGITLFAVGTVGAFLAFDWTPLIKLIVLTLLLAVVTVRIINTIAVFVLCPRVAVLRTLNIDTATARFAYHWFMAIAIIGVFGALCAVLIHKSGIAPGLATIVSTATGTIVLLMIVVMAWHRHRRRIARGDAKDLRVVVTTALAAVLWGLWISGLYALMWTLLILVLIPLLDRAFHRFVQDTLHLPDRYPTDTPDDPDDDTGGEDEILFDEHHPAGNAPQRGAILGPVLQRFVRVMLVVFGLILIGSAWDVAGLTLADESTLAGRLYYAAIDAVVAVLIADLVWVWGRTAIDNKMAEFPPLEPGHPPGPEARLATLLPLLRKILLVTLVVMVALVLLSSLGVNIGPLIAGAGVVGIAIGFGAQTLVRDIVSGIFFLLDDAFRVGEYIEMDNLRGTVESISVRSLRLRHHRGPVHTIPFGEMKSLTNHSRDWVIMKLELRVPFDTDLKLVKKIIKNIGNEMLENPEYGHHILEPLKSQGVRRMEEFNMVVGVKFMAKPGEQWTMRKEAYQRIRDAFDKHGINFAERNVKVQVIGDENLTDAQREAAIGAAQQSVENQLPPAPAPDEP